jgi:hypothetical protein
MTSVRQRAEIAALCDQFRLGRKAGAGIATADDGGRTDSTGGIRR